MASKIIFPCADENTKKLEFSPSASFVGDSQLSRVRHFERKERKLYFSCFFCVKELCDKEMDDKKKEDMDPRIEFLSSYVMKTFRIKSDRWQKLMMSDDKVTIDGSR